MTDSGLIIDFFECMASLLPILHHPYTPCDCTVQYVAEDL